MRLIDADALVQMPWVLPNRMTRETALECFRNIVSEAPIIDAEPVRHGRWILEAHDEKVNYRWHVTARCSECSDECKEIWAGFFPGVPDWLARDVAVLDARQVELSNYCPNCGAKMDGGKADA